MGEEGHVIGFTELYNQLVDLNTKLSSHISTQEVRYTEHGNLIDNLTKDMDEMTTRLDEEKRLRASLTRQFWFSIFSSLILPIVVLVAGTMFVTKGA